MKKKREFYSNVTTMRKIVFVSARGKNYKNHSAGGEGGGGSAKEKNEESIRELQVL